VAVNLLIYQHPVSDTHWSEYPIQTIVYAMRTMIGKCVLITLSIALGFGVGTALVDHSLPALISGTLAFFGTAFVSVFVSYGALAFLFIIAYAVISIVCELSEWTLVIPFCLCVWVGFDTTDYNMNRSPMARMQKELTQSLEKSAKEEKKQPSTPPNQKPAP